GWGGDEREPGGFYLCGGRTSVAVLFEIEAENARGPIVESPNGVVTELDDPWLGDRLRQSRCGGDATGAISHDEVGEPLGHLSENAGAVLPEGLKREVAAWKVFREREGRRRHAPRRLPVCNPAPSLLGLLDGDCAHRAGAGSDPAPQTTVRGKPLKEFLDPAQVFDWKRERRGEPAGAQEHGQVVLILAPLDHVALW